MRLDFVFGDDVYRFVAEAVVGAAHPVGPAGAGAELEWNFAPAG